MKKTCLKIAWNSWAVQAEVRMRIILSSCLFDHLMLSLQPWHQEGDGDDGSSGCTDAHHTDSGHLPFPGAAGG